MKAVARRETGAKKTSKAEEQKTVFAEKFVHAVVSLIGIQISRSVIEHTCADGEAELDEKGELKVHSSACLKPLVRAFTERVTADFGYEFSEGITENIFNIITDEYPDSETSQTLLAFLPENSLEKIRTHTLSREALEKHTFDRTKELEELNARLERTVRERTRELAEINHNLEKTNGKLEELSQAKTEFLSFASHQLKAPLAAINWASQALIDDEHVKEGESTQKNVHIIQESSKKMVDLISDLLNIARIEEGRFEYNFKAIVATDVFDDALNSLDEFAKRKDISIDRSFERHDFEKVRADKEKLYLVFENILTNAIKYTPEGKQVFASCTVTPPNLIFSVRDEGFGIPEEEQEKIFTKFFRASNVKEEVSGTGLGLYLVKKIVEDHKGSISFESKENEGTTVTITLPLARA